MFLHVYTRGSSSKASDSDLVRVVEVVGMVGEGTTHDGDSRLRGPKTPSWTGEEWCDERDGTVNGRR